jgi:hypothetical protein
MKFMGRKDEVTLREKTFYLHKFLGFYGGLWSNDSLLLTKVQGYKSVPTFRRNVLTPSLG